MIFAITTINIYFNTISGWKGLSTFFYIIIYGIDNILTNKLSELRTEHIETAITRVTTNILCDLNNTYVTILILLYLSEAFDTIDHSLISRLANIGIAGNALKWFYYVVHF